jgi:hypothetical protein
MAEIFINIRSRLVSCSRDDIETDIEEMIGGRGYISGAGSALDGSGSNIDIDFGTDEPGAIDQFVTELTALLRRSGVPDETYLRIITPSSDRTLPVYEDKS